MLGALIGGSEAVGQHDACGTAAPTKLQKRFTLEVVDAGFLRNSGWTQLPIHAHIVTLNDGTGGLSEEDVNIEIANLNYVFSAIDVEFFIDDINYINSTQYYDFDDTEEDALCGPNEVGSVVSSQAELITEPARVPLRADVFDADTSA